MQVADIFFPLVRFVNSFFLDENSFLHFHITLRPSLLHNYIWKTCVLCLLNYFFIFKFFFHLEFISCHMSQESNFSRWLMCSNHLLNNSFLPTDLTCIRFFLFFILLLCNSIIPNSASVLKTAHTCYFTVSVGQESGHSLVRFSLGLPSRCRWSCSLIRGWIGEGSIFNPHAH